MNLQFVAEKNADTKLMEVTMMVNGKEAGLLICANTWSTYWQIEKGEIEPEFRGMGLYRKLLQGAMETVGMECLRSYDRREICNSIYCHWLGENLDNEQDVQMAIENGRIQFYC